MGEVPIPKSAAREPSFDEMFPAVPEPVRPQQSVAAVTEPPAAAVPEASSVVPAAAPDPAARPETPAAGITHKVRWGDTLWELAAKYYGDPWLYRRIAKENGLTNANKLVSGTVVKIPPR
jgi:nucleoid-associated protein YgaU